MVKRAVCIFLIITNFILITGCWGYKEINELPIVIGCAIDKISKDEYLLTVEVIKTSEITGVAGELNVEILQMKGKTIFDAIRKFIVKNGKFLYWADMKVIIIGKEVVEEDGVISVLDLYYRDIEIRAEGTIIIADGIAADIFKENISAKRATSLFLSDMVENVNKNSEIYPQKMFEVIDVARIKSKELVLPILHAKDINPGNSDVSLESAVFKKEKIVGVIKGQEVQSYRLMINKETGGLRIENIIGEENAKVTYEIEKSKRRIKPIYKDGKFLMKIDITTNVNIAEVMSDKLDIRRADIREEMKEQLENTIKHNCQQLLWKTQNEYDSDILGYGELIKNKYPKFWKENEDNWDKIFPTITTEINVKVNFKGSALYSNIVE